MLHRSSFIRGGLVLVGITRTKNTSMRYFYLTSWVPAVQRLEIKPVDVRKKKPCLSFFETLLQLCGFVVPHCRFAVRFFFCGCKPAFPTFPHQNQQKSLVCGGRFEKTNTARRLSNKKKVQKTLTESNPWKYILLMLQKSSDHQWEVW